MFTLNPGEQNKNLTINTKFLHQLISFSVYYLSQLNFMNIFLKQGFWFWIRWRTAQIYRNNHYFRVTRNFNFPAVVVLVINSQTEYHTNTGHKGLGVTNRQTNGYLFYTYFVCCLSFRLFEKINNHLFCKYFVQLSVG